MVDRCVAASANLGSIAFINGEIWLFFHHLMFKYSLHYGVIFINLKEMSFLGYTHLQCCAQQVLLRNTEHVELFPLFQSTLANSKRKIRETSILLSHFTLPTKKRTIFLKYSAITLTTMGEFEAVTFKKNGLTSDQSHSHTDTRTFSDFMVKWPSKIKEELFNLCCVTSNPSMNDWTESQNHSRNPDCLTDSEKT